MAKLMEVKDWDDYSKEEQKELLQHWWYYYGKVLFTFAEWELFDQLVEKDSKQMLKLAVGSYTYGLSNQLLIAAMRKNKVNELMNSLPKVNETCDEKFRTIYTQVEKELISMLVSSYNDPKPNIPMESENIVNQVKDIVKRKKR